MGQSSLVFVNTRNILPSDQTTQNSVNVNLDEPIFVPEDHECLLSVNQAQIPNSFYSFSEPLTFRVRWNGLSKTITGSSNREGTLTLNNTTDLVVGRTIRPTGGATFAGLALNTDYVISEILTLNRIRLRDFTPLPRNIQFVVGGDLSVTSFNHIAQTVTLVNSTDIQIGDQIQFGVGWGFALPTGVTFYVVNKLSGNRIQISDRPGRAVFYPNIIPNIFMGRIAAANIQVISVNPTTEKITLGRTVGLTVGETVDFNETFCGIVAGTSYTIRTIDTATNEIELTSGGTLLSLTDSTVLTLPTIVGMDAFTGQSLTATSSTVQSFTIDTSTTAPAAGMPAGAYTLASFGATAAATNALVGKTLAYTNGITSTLTLSSSTVSTATASQLTAKPALVPKINITFAASSGTLADFVIENFTSYTLGFENQNIVGTGTLAVAHPMFAPRYILVGSSLRVPGQIPGGRIKFNPIATIPMQVTFGSVQAYVPPFPTEQRIDDDVIRSFTLQMYDELGNLVNFNGVEWQVVLEFKIQPKRKPVYKYSM